VNGAMQQRLAAGVEALGWSLTTSESERLLRFVTLLIKWNKAYNLTAVRDPIEMIERHLIDSLAVLPFVQGERILDMGTGAGLPGIPLAILSPERQFVLLDSNNKKIRFIRQVVLELGLQQVRPVHARVESWPADAPFDCIVCRAFTALPRMLKWADRLLAPKAVLLAMKGVIPELEIGELQAGYRAEVQPLAVPFTQGRRHLIIISRE